ncbi:sporulation integral membrane protein YlbJ [Clostridium tetani]|nr:sporulation integral membrane protein YlbJ [Clostridium tetani]
MVFVIYFIMILLSITLIYYIKDLSYILTFICTLLILFFILNPLKCIDSCLQGISLFFYKVFPSLFPFLVISNLILYSNGVSIYSKLLGKILCHPLKLPKQCSFPLVVSALCGYPLGAKYSCDLYEEGLIDFYTCRRLLNIASSASPLFIVGTLGASMLKDKTLGYIFLIASYLSCFTMGLIIPSQSKIKDYSFNKKNSPFDMGTTLKSSIENAIKTSTLVGGFVTLFFILNEIIKNSIIFNAISNLLYNLFKLPNELTQGFILGILEITNGCNLISFASIALDIKILVLGFLLGFSGICIIWQCNSFMSRLKFSSKYYVGYKLIQGIFCSIYSLLLYKYFYRKSSAFIFNNPTIIENKLVFIIIILLLLPFMIFNYKEIRVK